MLLTAMPGVKLTNAVRSMLIFPHPYSVRSNARSHTLLERSFGTPEFEPLEREQPSNLGVAGEEPLKDGAVVAHVGQALLAEAVGVAVAEEEGELAEFLRVGRQVVAGGSVEEAQTRLHTAQKTVGIAELLGKV